MALDGCSGGLRVTQEASKGSSVPLLPEHPAEQLPRNSEYGVHSLTETHVHNSVPASVCQRLSPHAVNSSAQHYSTRLSHAGAFVGNAQSSSISDVTLHEPQRYQQMEEKSEFVSDYLRALTAAAPSHPHQSSCLPSAPLYVAAQQLQDDAGDTVSQWAWPTGMVSIRADLPSSHSRATHNLLRSGQAPASTNTAASEVNPLSTTADAVRRERITSSVAGEHIRQTDPWIDDGTTKASYHTLLKDFVAEPPQNPLTLNDLRKTPFQLASQENCCLSLNDYNSTKFAAVMEYKNYRDAAECPSQDVNFSEPCLPISVTCGTTTIDVEDERCLQKRQTLVTVAGKRVDLEDSAVQSRRRSNNDKTATLLEVLPLASPLPPHDCVVSSDNGDVEQDTGILGLCWSAIQTGREAGKTTTQTPQSVGKREQQYHIAGEGQKVEDTGSLLAQRQMCGHYCSDATENGSSGGPREERGATSKTEQHFKKTERISAFIAALHSFLVSGELFDETDSQVNVKNVAEALSLLRPPYHKKGHEEPSAAKPTVFQPEVVPLAASEDASTSCCTQATEEKKESLTHSTKTSDAAPVAFGCIGDLLGRPFYPSNACSERTSYCSGITALGSEMSGYAGTSFDRSASYSSCSSFGGGCHSTLATVMLSPSGTLEYTETEKVELAGCTSLQGSSPTSPTSCTEGVAPGVAPHQKNYAVMAAGAATATRSTIKNEHARLGPEASRFQKLVRAFYADNSRHSVLWDESQQGVPSYGSSTQGVSTVQRETWTAAAGIVEVMQQVKVLVKRLRGLQLVTRELAALPDASGALCCCLSGDLTADATAAGRTATYASTRWKFEQLLVLTVQDDGSADGVQRRNDEVSAVRTDEMPVEHPTGLHGFQIQDEVFVISPVYGSHASTTEAVTVVSPGDSVGQQRSNDASSEGGSKDRISALVRVQGTSAGNGYRCPLGHGWTALLKWKGHHGVREWTGSSRSGHNLRNALRSSCRDVKASTAQPLLQSTCAGVGAASASSGQNVIRDAIIGKNGERPFEENTGSNTSNISFSQQAGQRTAGGKNSSFPPASPYHRMDRLHAENAASELWSPARDSKLEGNSERTSLKARVNREAVATTTGVTCQVLPSSQLARVPTTTYSGEMTDPLCHDELQLYSKQRIQEFANSGVAQHDHSSAPSAPKSRTESGGRRSTLPVLGTVREAATVSPKQLMNALLHCLQDFDVKGDTSSSFKIEECSLATANNMANVTAADANSKAYPSCGTHKDSRESQLSGPASKLELSPGADICDSAEAPTKNIPVAIEWGAEDSSGEGARSSGSVEAERTTQKGLTSGRQRTRKRNSGGEGLDGGVSRDLAPRRRCPRDDAKGRDERLESPPDIEEHLHSLGFFREHCTVFVSWVPRAARADDFKQKTSMEMRLKVLLQMAMGVRGIVRVALFPPRGSHCCVLFESPAAASAFIQEYGGPTYTSTTEQFKADICAAYAVALDRGIERVFIRIEEFKPHVLQQHLLQQARERSTLGTREWHERRRHCATTHHPAVTRWRQHQLAALREKGRKSAHYHSPAGSVQPSRNSLSSHDLHSKEAANGKNSASPRLWQTHERNSESCSAHRPVFRQYISQQLLENFPHQEHRPHHGNR